MERLGAITGVGRRWRGGDFTGMLIVEVRMSTYEEAMVTASESARTAGQGVAERLLEKLGGAGSARAVFGEPVERDGVTVVPVAKVRWGGGGGGGGSEGSESNPAGSGSGGGGGLAAAPVGYIEITDGRARFVPITRPSDHWPLLLAAGFTAWLVLRALKGLVR